MPILQDGVFYLKKCKEITDYQNICTWYDVRFTFIILSSDIILKRNVYTLIRTLDGILVPKTKKVVVASIICILLTSSRKNFVLL